MFCSMQSIFVFNLKWYIWKPNEKRLFVCDSDFMLNSVESAWTNCWDIYMFASNVQVMFNSYVNAHLKMQCQGSIFILIWVHVSLYLNWIRKEHLNGEMNYNYGTSICLLIMFKWCSYHISIYNWKIQCQGSIAILIWLNLFNIWTVKWIIRCDLMDYLLAL